MKNFLCSIFLVLISTQATTQEKSFSPSGKAFATIFANFHQGITAVSANDAAFELVRGYLGYEYIFSPEWYAKINLDIGSPDDLSPYAKQRRYAYFKNAYLRFTANKLQVEFGLIGLKQFKLQESIWERRYLMKTLADEYRLGSSADLGVNFHYAFSGIFDADLTIMNGEGYNNIQTDGIFKYGIGSTLRIPKDFTSRVFYDVTYNELFQTTLLLFTSYAYRKKWNIAGEFIFRKNDAWQENHDIFGLSVFGKYNINNQFQLFARFDKIKSNILEGESSPWHLAEDGSALVAGIQYSPVKNIKMAINYHDWYPWAANRDNNGFIYLNLLVKM